MTCALIVFYLAGAHVKAGIYIKADMPPIRTVLTQARAWMRDGDWRSQWPSLGVYPVIEECCVCA